MKNKILKVSVVLSMVSVLACSQTNETPIKPEIEVSNQKTEKIQTEPHEYGGWYCPDNLNGFPAVDIANWKMVPVVNGRMPTKEETQNGTSLIFVDPVAYPNAKPLDISMPKLAHYQSEYSNRDELIIVIQAFNVENDSIVGFRYLNGGNGSARLNEVNFLSEAETKEIPALRFVSETIEINATQSEIWKVLTAPEYATELRQVIDQGNIIKTPWAEKSNVNYYYPNSGDLTATFGGELYGNYYIQNDYEVSNFTEKFLVIDNQESIHAQLKIACGPFGADFETQKNNLYNWAQKVKELSEKRK